MYRQTEVDGIPTLLSPMPGPLTAGLTFRVGRADETLASTGITHLIEHLALHGHAPTDYHFNGATGPEHTHFLIQGNEPEVVSFLNAVCVALGDLPMSRLETEKAILRTEENSGTRSANESMPMWRYGATGYGLISYPEWGLYRLTPEDVLQWTRTWFTRQNAVLWMTSADVPAGLRLPLPEGRRMSAPVPSSALPTTPAFYPEGSKRVVVDAVVRHRSAAGLYAGVLERELFRSLRQEGGFSYAATSAYERRGDGYATITALADALPDKQDAVLGGFIDVLAKLRLGRIDPADVEAVRSKRLEIYDHPDVDAHALPTYAKNFLSGQPNVAAEEVRAATTQDVCEVAVEAAGTALLQVPAGTTADWGGFTVAPQWSSGAVAGQRFLSRDDPENALVIGDRGVSLDTPHGAVTVLYHECVAMLSRPDGGRQLIGADGMLLRLEPTLFHADGQAWGYVDSQVPPRVIVPLPARKPEDIPQPDHPASVNAGVTSPAAYPTGPARPPENTRPPEKTSVLEKVTLVVLAIVTGVFVCGGGLLTLGAATDDSGLVDGGVWAVIGGVWCIALVVALPLIVLARRFFRRRDAV
jgi:hypothetical protein